MPRIGYIAYPTSLQLQSANAIQTWSTLRALRDQGADLLILIARWGRGPSRFDDVGAVHLPRPALGRLSRLYRSTLWYYAERSVFAAMCALVIALQRPRVDVIYVREVICAAWWAALWGPLLRLPVVYEAHDLESWNPSRAREAWVQPVLNLIDRLALSRASRITSLTGDFRDLLARLGWQSAERIDVIPDAFDPAIYAPRMRDACRAELGIASEAQVIVYAGLTFAYRRLDLLIDAVADLAATRPTLHVMLVGGRPTDIAALAEQVAARGVAAHVHFIGQVTQEHAARYLGAADVLVIPDTVTSSSASPLKLFEYMAAGRPIVLPDLAALREIATDDDAWYFRRGSRADLARALARALDDTPASTARAARALVRVQRYTYAGRASQICATAHHAVRGDSVPPQEGAA